MTQLRVSTPSRLCLFGEHQDYLGLEVIAVAIDLRFYATLRRRSDRLIRIRIRDSRLNRLDSVDEQQVYQLVEVDLDRPIVFRSRRDYLLSSLSLLLAEGYPLTGFDLQMDSQIPIGKGMCSSSAMIVVLIKALLEGIGHPDRLDARRIAELAYRAEVIAFNEPGGRMDHYTSALGGMVHMNFGDIFTIESLPARLPGCFILIDSLAQKDTTKVLASAKEPTLAALDRLKRYGIGSVRDFLKVDQPDSKMLGLLQHLEPMLRQKLMANIENLVILKQGLKELSKDTPDGPALGELLNQHHAQLRDGLGISTPLIERLLQTALAQGAWGGKINGSGGGGCCFVYADESVAGNILQTMKELGYPAKKLRQDQGVRRDENG